jgi:hypothetical protein
MAEATTTMNAGYDFTGGPDRSLLLLRALPVLRRRRPGQRDALELFSTFTKDLDPGPMRCP